MRLGHDDNFLSIESTPLKVGHPGYRAEAVVIDTGQKFTASHDWVVFDSSVETTKRFADFQGLKSNRVEIPLITSGWVRLERDARGYITVHYRIGGWETHAAMEGEIVIEGEFTNGFCREFGALLKTQN